MARRPARSTDIHPPLVVFLCLLGIPTLLLVVAAPTLLQVVLISRTLFHQSNRTLKIPGAAIPRIPVRRIITQPRPPRLSTGRQVCTITATVKTEVLRVLTRQSMQEAAQRVALLFLTGNLPPDNELLLHANTVDGER